MSVNATPEYEKAELRYRQAETPAEQLESLQEMLRLIPKHKSSEKVQSNIKQRISAVRKTLARADKSGAGYVDPYHVPAGGAGQVTLVGLPNTGKSSIVAAVTQAPVKVTDYPYGTTTPIPAMWPWQDVQISLVDTPPIMPDHIPGGMVNLLRQTGVVAVVADAASTESLDQVEAVVNILAERRIELFDCPVGRIPAYVNCGKPGLLAVTRADVAGAGEIAVLSELVGGRLAVCGLDCTTGAGFDQLGEHIWRLLNVIRVYTKRPGHKARRSDPFTLPAGATVEDLARGIHRDLPGKLKFARIWGDGRYAGQQVHRTECLRDKDLVEIHE